MKKFKLILLSFLLALTLVTASAGYTPVYAEDDPQGTVEKRPKQPAAGPSMADVIAAIMAGLMGII